MKEQTAGYLLIFGIFTVLLGVVGYQTHPDKAPFPLVFGGSFGTLLVLWGILGARGARWSRPAAVLSVVLLMLACMWRVSVGWLAVAHGDAERTFPTLVMTLMLVVAGALLWFLLTDGSVGSRAEPAKDRP